MLLTLSFEVHDNSQEVLVRAGLEESAAWRQWEGTLMQKMEGVLPKAGG
jgi:hypothetical protein